MKQKIANKEKENRWKNELLKQLCCTWEPVTSTSFHAPSIHIKDIRLSRYEKSWQVKWVICKLSHNLTVPQGGKDSACVLWQCKRAEFYLILGEGSSNRY